MRKILSIHPAIGVARVGDSKASGTEGYFLGPEVPGFDFTPAPFDETGTGEGRSRDNEGGIRRQAARFRIFEKEIDDLDRVTSVREITSSEAKITWKVSVANTKASGKRFPPYFHDEIPEGLIQRNPTVTDREKLNIRSYGEIKSDGGPRKLRGEFMSETVLLAELLTDEDGRLIFLGGRGEAASPENVELYQPRIRHAVYNCDGWYDDTCDGSISASVQFPRKAPVEVDQKAWVIVGPPDFAPPVQSPVTMYDVAHQANLPHRAPSLEDVEVSFARDIYPILRRATDLQWVSAGARAGHGGSAPGNFLTPQRLDELSSNDPTNRPLRERFVNRLTPPGSPGPSRDMPDVFGGVDPQNPTNKPRPGTFGIPLTVTQHQYDQLKRWARGDFVNDWQANNAPSQNIDDYAVESQPDLLDRAGLDACVGGSFHPGIEASFVMALESTYDEWFRIAGDKTPGDLTQYMAVPWHTDFLACSELWWPGQRPNSVKVVDGANTEFRRWDRGISSPLQIRELGFIKKSQDSDGLVEQERILPESPLVG
ncbi:hypothetical protein IWQ54_003429 [Labrenzia sp. EL_195]|nr:hypothetical protein [Labrenzia sp. EL_195]